MTDFVIPCDTFVRLSNVLHDFLPDGEPWFTSIRIDNGQAVATNRSIMAIENIGGPAGIVHVIADPALIEQCRKEAPFKSTLTITVNEPLKFAVAKTMLGYVHPGNCAVWSDAPNDFDKWRETVLRCKEPVAKSSGGMFWNADGIARLAAASPSGGLIFEETIDANGARPTLIRDVAEHDWLGVFNPFSSVNNQPAATLPSWMMK
jgi:hypothetical protein